MKKFLFLILASVCAILFVGCGNDPVEEEEVLWDAKPSVMIDGILYGTTGRSPTYRTDDTPQNGGRVDGEITSSVESYEYPEENDQSNFGTGYAYRYGEGNTVEVFSESANKWIIYEPYEDQ